MPINRALLVLEKKQRSKQMFAMKMRNLATVSNETVYNMVDKRNGKIVKMNVPLEAITSMGMKAIHYKMEKVG